MQTWNKTLSLIAFSFISFTVSAQNMPQPGNVSAPKMPTISSPTIGGGFYSPEISSPEFPQIKNFQTQETAKSSESNKTSPEEKNNESSPFSLLTNLMNFQGTESQGKILRFNLENKDILSTTKNISVSTVSENQSIIISGSSFSELNGNPTSETFYMLLTPDTTKHALKNYNVTIVLKQSAENTETPLFHLSQEKNLTASRTGNLVKINVNTTDFLADLGEI